MHRILRAESVGFVALVTMAACGGAEDFASTRVDSGYAMDEGISPNAGYAPDGGISPDASPPPSAGATPLGCPDSGDAAPTAALADHFVAVSVGNQATCALTTSGAVQCWGSPLASSPYPVTVPGLETGATAISAGNQYACALTAGGAVQCWGAGQGTGSVAPPAVVPGLEGGVVAVSVGGGTAGGDSFESAFSACAVTAGGTVECWGDNTYGQLGNGSSGFSSSGTASFSTPSEAVPVPVTGLGNGVTSVSVGGLDACAVTAGGTVECWGDNTYGQLGIDPTTLAFSAVPVTVPGLTSGVTAVSVGNGAACALTAGGEVVCWGNAWSLVSSAQLPWGPVPVAGLSGGATAVAVTSNGGCALTAGGGVFCWGEELAMGTVYPPMTVAGLESGATAVAVGNYGDACAVTADGRVECWGWGYLYHSLVPKPFGLACAYSGADAAGAPPSSADSSATACADPLTFADPSIEADVRGVIGVPSGPIHPADVAGFTELVLVPPAGTPVTPPPGYVGPVTSLEGVECLWNLRTIAFEAYSVDLTPLSNLPNLTVLYLDEVRETNIPRLAHVTEFHGELYSNAADILSALPSLKALICPFADVSTPQARAALSALTGLTALSLPGAGLTDTAPLAPLSLLTDVDIDSNQIQDISSLSALPNLQSLDLSGNQITDLSPLVANPSLGYGTGIAIGNNPIDCAAQAQNIATLRARGVTLTTECP
jgi:hypothetical protein